MSLTIRSGQSISETRNSLRRFRVSWTYEPNGGVEDPRDVALSILRRAYVQKQANDRLFQALSRQMMFSSQPDFQDATAYASSAVSLRPDDPRTLNTLFSLC